MSASIAQRHVGDVVSGGNIFDQLAQVARDPSIDAGKLSVIYELMKDYQEQQRKDEANRARVAFYAALPDMQKELPVIRRDANNPHTRSNYARLETIWEKCCPIWTKWGFAVVYDTKMTNGQISTTMRLMHRAGHAETFHAPEAAPDTTGIKGATNKTSVQGNQSVISYQKRGLLGCLGIVTAEQDDDGAGGLHPSSVVQRRGRDMPPVGREDSVRVITGRNEYPADAPPPAGSMREAAQSILTAADEQWLNELEVEFAAAHTVTEITEIVGSQKVRNAKKKAPRIVVERIEELEANAMERIDRETAANSPFEEQAPTDGEDQ